MALLHVHFRSEVLEQNVDMDVILPENTKGLIGMAGTAQGTYPTLYLLHGMSDDHTIWQRRTSIERYAAQYNLAVVMPDADLSWYTDMAYGDAYFTFIAKELPAICQSMFPKMKTGRENNFVAGLSMGGYGALKIALRCGDSFSCAAALSGGVDVGRILKDQTLKDRRYWEDIFGDSGAFDGSFNDLFAAAEELKASGKPLPKLYMWCGTEDFLYEGNLAMRDHLRTLKYPLVWEDSAGGHSWALWDEKIQDVLSWLPIGGAQ